MKTSHSIKTAIGLFLALTVACSSEKQEEDLLRVLHYENNEIILFYPDDIGSLTIAGGTAPYSVRCESEIVKVDTEPWPDEWPHTFHYETLGTGEAHILISDASGQTLVLHARIIYREWNVEIREHYASVNGELLTLAAQKELKEKALAAIPVEVGGGYKFIFTEREAGSVYVYKEKIGAAYTEGSFTVSPGEESRLFHLRFDDTVHTYVEYRQPLSRATLSPLVVVAFYEELTEKFKPEYPEAESVYSFQYFYQR